MSVQRWPLPSQQSYYGWSTEMFSFTAVVISLVFLSQNVLCNRHKSYCTSHCTSWPLRKKILTYILLCLRCTASHCCGDSESQVPDPPSGLGMAAPAATAVAVLTQYHLEKVWDTSWKREIAANKIMLFKKNRSGAIQKSMWRLPAALLFWKNL